MTAIIAITIPDGRFHTSKVVAPSGYPNPLPPPPHMIRSMATLLRAFLLLGAAPPASVAAQQPITLDDVEEGLPEITADEPIAVEFSAEKASAATSSPMSAAPTPSWPCRLAASCPAGLSVKRNRASRQNSVGSVHFVYFSSCLKATPMNRASR